MTMRPWAQTTPNIAQSDYWFMGDYSWRRSCNAPMILSGQRDGMMPLCFALKRKLLNLFVEFDAEATGFVTLEQAMRALSAGIDLADGKKRAEHEAAVTDWWRVLSTVRDDLRLAPPPLSRVVSTLSGSGSAASGDGDRGSSTAQQHGDAGLGRSVSANSTSSSAAIPRAGEEAATTGSAAPGAASPTGTAVAAALSKEDWLLVFQQIYSSDAAVSTEDLPSWLLTPSLSRFRLAKKVTEGQMTLQEWEDWQKAAHPLSPEELSKRTWMESTGGAAPATLKDIFVAADAGRKGHITEDEYAYIVRRWWRSTEHWDELLDFSLF